jgi:hypothetical protein
MQRLRKSLFNADLNRVRSRFEPDKKGLFILCEPFLSVLDYPQWVNLKQKGPRRSGCGGSREIAKTRRKGAWAVFPPEEWLEVRLY